MKQLEYGLDLYSSIGLSSSPLEFAQKAWSELIELPSRNVGGKLNVPQKKFPCGHLNPIWPFFTSRESEKGIISLTQPDHSLRG